MMGEMSLGEVSALKKAIKGSESLCPATPEWWPSGVAAGSPPLKRQVWLKGVAPPPAGLTAAH